MKHKDVSAELQAFIEDLEVWAKSWVEEVNEVVLEHIEELFNDEAVRYLVKKYKEEKLKCEKMNKGYLLSAYVWGNMSKYKSLNIECFSQVLYELCYKRYTKEK